MRAVVVACGGGRRNTRPPTPRSAIAGRSRTILLRLGLTVACARPSGVVVASLIIGIECLVLKRETEAKSKAWPRRRKRGRAQRQSLMESESASTRNTSPDETSESHRAWNPHLRFRPNPKERIGPPTIPRKEHQYAARNVGHDNRRVDPPRHFAIARELDRWRSPRAARSARRSPSTRRVAPAPARSRRSTTGQT